MAIYIVCLGVCDPKGYEDWECGRCGTGRCCVSLLQNSLKMTHRCAETCSSLICLTNCILLSVFVVDVSIIIVCWCDGNEIQKSLYCFQHALYILYIINERNRTDGTLYTSGVDIICNVYRVLYNAWAR